MKEKKKHDEYSIKLNPSLMKELTLIRPLRKQDYSLRINPGAIAHGAEMLLNMQKGGDIMEDNTSGVYIFPDADSFMEFMKGLQKAYNQKEKGDVEYDSD